MCADGFCQPRADDAQHVRAPAHTEQTSVSLPLINVQCVEGTAKRQYHDRNTQIQPNDRSMRTTVTRSAVIHPNIVKWHTNQVKFRGFRTLKLSSWQRNPGEGDHGCRSGIRCCMSSMANEENAQAMVQRVVADQSGCYNSFTIIRLRGHS